MKIRFIYSILFLVTACTPGTIPAPRQPTLVSSDPTAITQGDNPTMAPTPSTPTNSHLHSQIKKAIGNLARQLSILETEIVLVEATEVVWSDSSLGCPKKGIVYADVLTPGYLIILGANNMEYEYHSSKGTELVHCENPNPPVQEMPGDT